MTLSRRELLRVGAALLPLAGPLLLGAGRKAKGDFSTIQGALEAAEPGDTIELPAGTYHEKIVFPRSGEPGAPITLTGVPGAQVVMDGADPMLQTDPGGRWTHIGGGVYRTVDGVPYEGGDPTFAITSWISRYQTSGSNDADRLIAAYASLGTLQEDDPPRGEGSYRSGQDVYVKLDGGADPNAVGLSVPRMASVVQLNGQSNVSIQNLEIRNGGWAGVSMGGQTGPIEPGNPGPYENITLEDLTIQNCFRGVSGNRVAGPTIRRARVLNGKVAPWPRAGGFVPGVGQDPGSSADNRAPWRGFGIFLGHCTDGEVDDCLVSGQWDGLAVGGCDNVRIHHCTVRDIWDDGIDVASSNPQANIECFNNHLYEVNVAFSVTSNHPGPIYIYRNVTEGYHVRGSSTHSIKSGDDIQGRAEDVKFYHNTFYSDRTSNVWEKLDDAAPNQWDGYDFVNNIFHSDGSENYNFRGAGREDDGGVNHWEANVYNIDEPDEQDALTLPNLENHYLNFGSTPRDLRLIGTSPAADSGSSYPAEQDPPWPDSVGAYPGGRNRGAWDDNMAPGDIGASQGVLDG